MKTLHTINTNFAKRMFVSLMALMTIGITSVFGVEYVAKLSVTSDDILNSAGQGSGYRAYSCTIDEVGWLITHGGSGSTGAPIGTNSGSRSSCNLSNYPQYAVAPVTTGDLASVFVNTTPINNVSKISYTCTDDEESATTNVYLIYSLDGTHFIQMPLSTDNQGANLSQSTEYTFAESSGYFGLLFLGKTNSGDWRVQNVSITFYGYSGTPPTHKVTWEVNGEVYHTEFVVENNRVTMPEIPTDDCGDKTFVGWTTSEVSEGNDAPQILFEASAQYPAITEETTFYAVFADLDNTSAGTITDNITATLTGITSNAYTEWTNKQSNSDAVYAGKSNNSSNAIGIRDNEKTHNTGIITLKSGGKAKKVIIEWNTATSGDDRKLQVYGKRTPYESVADIHDPNKQGALLGLIDYDKNQTTLEISGNYEYIGLSSFTGALCINNVSIEWESKGSYSGYTTSCTPKYTVTLDPNGGDGGDYTGWTENVGNYTKRINKNTSVDLPIPTKSGYYFDGWYHNSTKVSSPYIVTEDVTLTANWITLTNFRTSCSYTVTWQANGGQWSDETTEIEEEYNVGETITPPDDPTRTGYTFAGWEPVVPATMPAEDQTFKAIWENCRWVEVTDNNTLEDGDEVVITMSKGLFTWTISNTKNTSTAPTANDITANIQGNYLTTVSDEYKWVIEKNNANLTFYSYSDNANYLYCTNDDNGVRIGTGAAKVYVVDGNYLKNTQTIVPRYVGISFNTNPYTWRCYTGTTGVIADETLKFYKRVCIEENQHWVTWDANGGLFADGSATKTDFFTVGATITHPTPTREGYTFTGWTPATNTMPNEDITLVAQWQVNTYTVTWNANGGKFGNETSVEQSYSYGAPITAPTPTRTGYTFAGWDSEVPTTMPASHLTYNAQWNCTSPTDIKINGAYIVFPGETIELTVTGNNIADDASYQWYKKNGDSYDELTGQISDKLIIANATANDAGNYKCVVTNGTCSGENNYTVKMYRLRGLKDDTWNIDYVFEKTNDNKGAYFLELNGATTYEFKIHDGSAYYGNTGDDPTMTSGNCTNWEMEENMGKNVKLQTTITGTYTFTLDYQNKESRPLISVTYPQKKIIYLDPGVWKANNAKFVVHVWTNGVDNGKDILMTRVDDCNKERIIYQAEIEASHDRIIFVRCNPSGFSINNIRDKEWNRSSTQWLTNTLPGYQFNIEEWSNGGTEDGKTCSKGSWSDFIQFYTISYNMNGHGTQIADDCVEDGHAWDAPTDPTAVGYTFLGWRRPATTNDNTLYKYGQTGFTPTANEELTAQWSFSMEYEITGNTYVTSAVGQTIKATTPLQLAVSNMPVGTKVAISAPNITFYDEAGNAITEVTTKNNPEQFNLTIAYTPTVEKTTEQPTITLSVLGNEKTFDGHISARSLPNTFAIVAKVGNLWYALPSQGLNSTDDLMGYAIEVDNQDDPTFVTSVPANADWSLRQVYAGQNANATKDRFKQYGNNLVFVNSDVKALNASSSGSHVLTDAKYTNYYDQYPGRYEWTPITTDLETYQLTNAQRTDRELSIDILTRFGVYAGEITDIRFLPIQEPRYTQAALQVVEWKENSVVIMYNGDPAQTATLAIDGTTQIGAANLNDVKKDVAIYELPASGLMNYATKPLLITIGTSKKWLTIPYIINNSTTDVDVLNSTNTTKEVAAVTDVVVLNDATFTAAGTKKDKYTFRTIHVYGGGKLVVPSEATEGLGIYSLVMRSGTIENGTYTNSYPQLVMNGKYSNTSGIYLDYITTYERYYALSVPYSVKTKNIKYPADIYGDNLKDGGNKASFALQYYDGVARATGASGWKDFDESGDDPTLTQYHGYTFWGAPRKVSVNGGDMERQKYGIHRIQLTGVGAEDLLKSETENKTINITAYPANRPNDMGWNFLGNPYLAQYGGLSADNELVQVGLLEQEMIDGKWTGGWKHTGNLRYITTTTDGQTYTPVEVDKATFSPFNTFFIQAANNGALQFTSASRAQNAPARHYAAQQEAAKEITTGIILTGNDQTDRTGLLIADNFTEEYDFNADLSKFENSGINLYTIGKDGKLAFMAINQALAEQPIPLGYSAPADGEYTIAFDEDRYSATDISALYLIDYDRNETTNLLHTDYSFVTTAGTNNERFALQVAFIPQNATSVEWVDDATIQVAVDGNNLLLNNLPTDAGVQVFDALGRVIYATPNAPTEMQITLPTGYYLVRIADKQHAVVINTVIP